jgi:hypothetical protein
MLKLVGKTSDKESNIREMWPSSIGQKSKRNLREAYQRSHSGDKKQSKVNGMPSDAFKIDRQNAQRNRVKRHLENREKEKRAPLRGRGRQCGI